VISKVLDLKHETFTMMSQGSKTLTTYNDEDVLHCVVSGQGEHITLVSPY
jgi:hypothetical protein